MFVHGVTLRLFPHHDGNRTHDRMLAQCFVVCDILKLSLVLQYQCNLNCNHDFLFLPWPDIHIFEHTRPGRNIGLSNSTNIK